MGGRGGFNPGAMLAGAFVHAMDTNGNGVITREEFGRAMDGWFESWEGTNGPLTADQTRAGIERQLAGLQ